MQLTTRDLSQAVNWLIKHGVRLEDCNTAVNQIDEWIPIREGRVRIIKDGSSYTAELESYRA